MADTQHNLQNRFVRAVLLQMRELGMGVSRRGEGGRRTVNHSSLAPEPGSMPVSHRVQCHRPAQDGRQVGVTLTAWLRPHTG